MKIYYDKNHQPEKVKVFLGTPTNKVLCPLDGIKESSFDLEVKVGNTSTLSFDCYRFIEKDGKEIKSKAYDLLSKQMRVFVENVGWFIMDEPETDNDGKQEYKTVSAESVEIEMKQHNLRGLLINKGTTDSAEMLIEGNTELIGEVEFAKKQIKFYDENDPRYSFLDVVMNWAGLYGWSVGYVDNVPKTYRRYEDGEYKEYQVLLADEIGSFDVDSRNLYQFLTQDAAQYFECIFVFDYINFTVSAYRPENLGKDTNINIGFRNLQQSNQITADNENMFNRYYVTGSDNLGITYVNPLGNWIENLTNTYLNEKYMTPELIKKYKLWYDDLESERIPFMNATKGYNEQIAKITELRDRVPLDDCSTDWSTFSNDKLLEAQDNYKAQLKGYESLYVNSDKEFVESELQKSPDANDYYQIRDVILPSIQIEMDNRHLEPGKDPTEYIKSFETDWKLYGLDELRVKLDNYRNTLTVCQEMKYTEPYDESSGHTEDTHNEWYKKYLDAVNQLNPDYVGGCQEAYNQRQEQIEFVQAVQKEFDDERKAIIKRCEKETWSHEEDGETFTFSRQDLVDLSSLYIDADYTNDNMFLTSSDDSVTAIDEQLKLLDAAILDLDTASTLQYTVTVSSDNFIALYDYKNYTDNLNCGDFIWVGVRDDSVLKLRVISLKYNPLVMDNNLQIGFSNMLRSKQKRTDSADLLHSSGSNASKNSASGASNNYTTNEGVGLTPALIQRLVASGSFANGVTQVISQYANVIGGQGGSGGSGDISVASLNAKLLKAVDIEGENGFFEYLQSKLISTDKIISDSADFKTLNTLVAQINNLLSGTVSAELGHLIKLTAENVVIDEAVIRELIAGQMTVAMLQAGDISTDSFKVKSDDGGLQIVGNTMQFKDAAGNTRIQIGRDAANNFTFTLYDEAGTGVLIDSSGIKESAISDGLIVGDMIAQNTIGEDKLSFKAAKLNDDGKIDAAILTVNGEGLEAKFTTLENTIEQNSYTIFVKATNGSVFRYGNIDTTLYPQLLKNGVDVTDAYGDEHFIWTRSSSDTTGDTYWNEQHSTPTKTLRITREDVFVGASFGCSFSVNGQILATSGKE